MPDRIETLFSQLDAALEELQDTLQDKPGRRYLVQNAREDLARARWYTDIATEREGGVATVKESLTVGGRQYDQS